MQYNLNSITDKNGSILIKSYYSSVAPGRRAYREHHHTECELSVFIYGDGTYTVNNKDYNFTDGDVFLFRGDEPHCITNINTEFKLLNIRFDPKILWQGTDDLTALKILFARGKIFENRIKRNCDSADMIRASILKIADEMENRREGYRTVSKLILTNALITLVRECDFSEQDTEIKSLKRTIPYMTEILDYINLNLDKPLTLEEIAAKAALSPTYFSSVFKKLNGIPLWEYITIKRVEKAVDLLETTDLTKLDIAFRCGFNSSSNFYKAFMKVTGKNPGDFKSHKHKTEQNI